MQQAMYFLEQKDMPTRWYNIQADLPEPLPPSFNPITKEPLTPDFLSALFPMEIIMQEVSTERWIEIPEEVQDVYSTYRPTALHRAYRLEKALDTPAKIFYKYEGTSQAGSHKPNTAIAQAYYNKKEGIKRITTETGAGQWGSALAMGCAFFDIELKVKTLPAYLDGNLGCQLCPQPQPGYQSRAGHAGKVARLSRQPGTGH
jgi:tryptophan synthase beta chain